MTPIAQYVAGTNETITVERLKSEHHRKTTMRPVYGGIRNSGLSGILPVGMVTYTQAVKHHEATFLDLSLPCCTMMRKTSMMNDSGNIMPSLDSTGSGT